MTVRICVLMVMCLGAVSVGWGQATTTEIPAPTSGPTTLSTRPRTEAQHLAEQLGAADPAEREKAWARIQELLAEPEKADRDGRPGVVIEAAWVRALQRTKRHDEAERLAWQGILRRPGDAAAVTVFQRLRVQTFLAQKKYSNALAEAKSLYNVSSLKESAPAIDLVAQALAASKNGKEIAAKFREQQQAYATTRPTAHEGENVLKTISVDAAPYKAAIESHKGDSTWSLLCAGNLLLMSDQPGLAKAKFEKALAEGRVLRDVTAALEGVARSIRAETGQIGPANAYILQKREE